MQSRYSKYILYTVQIKDSYIKETHISEKVKGQFKEPIQGVYYRGKHVKGPIQGLYYRGEQVKGTIHK